MSSNMKRDARALQRLTGAAYRTCLQWVEVIDEEDLLGPLMRNGATREEALLEAYNVHFKGKTKG